MSLQKPSISTVIICYNEAKHLERTFRCLDAQTYRNFNVIIINDGSTDETQALAERLCSERQNCAVYSYENSGSAEARNRGIALATGDYIHFLDADDWFYPTMYERMAGMITAHDMPDAVTVDYRWVYDFDENDVPELKDDGKDIVVEGNKDIVERLARKTIGISEDDILAYYKTGDMTWNERFTPVSNFLHKRSTIVDNGLQFPKDMRVGDNRLFNVKFFAYAEKVVYTNSVYYLYLNNPTGLISTMLSDPIRMYGDKMRYLVERDNLRMFFLSNKGINLFHDYRGSSIMACFQLAATLVKLPYKEGLKYFLDFTDHRIVRESINDFPVKGAPLKIRLPLFMLQHKMHNIFYALVWLASKVGIRFKQI